MTNPRRKVLLQLDSDLHPSSFDALVAIDAGVDVLLPYGQVAVSDVTPLVHGAIFTRGVKDLHSTAIFVGGSSIATGEALYQAVAEAFVGPMQVSVMLDSNGANSTSVAAILCVLRHLPLEGRRVLVLAATGSVGKRVSQLAVQCGAHVTCHSRSMEKLQRLQTEIPSIQIQTADDIAGWNETLRGAEVVFACGAAGVELLDSDACTHLHEAHVLVDLNAVPPRGLACVEPMHNGALVNGKVCYGALGVGGLKMKVHRLGLQRLFQTPPCRLDLQELFDLAKQQSASLS